jgi:hypothetical protein
VVHHPLRTWVWGAGSILLSVCVGVFLRKHRKCGNPRR